MIADLVSLLDHARAGDTDAARQLADLIEEAIANPHRRVGAALRLRRRGGEPEDLAERRAIRDAALCDLAHLIGADLSLSERAAAVVRKTRLFRPARQEGDRKPSDAELLLHRITGSGLPVPGKRQVRRILAMHSPVGMANDTWQRQHVDGEQDAS